MKENAGAQGSADDGSHAISGHNWVLPSPQVVLDCIEEWRSLDLRSAAPEVLDASLTSFLAKMQFAAWANLRIAGTRTIWRARLAERTGEVGLVPWPWSTVSSLLYPPPADCHSQRCNRERDPVLYCSDEVVTALREIRSRPGDKVVMIRYNIRDASIHVVVPRYKVTDINGRALFDAHGTISFLILREFIRSEFTRPVGRGTEFLYRICEAMCRLWFDDTNNNGWMYPSVEAPTQVCFALKREFADSDALSIESAELVEILEERDRCFVVRRLKHAAISQEAVSWTTSESGARWIRPKSEER